MKVVLEKRLEQSLKAQIGLPVLSALMALVFCGVFFALTGKDPLLVYESMFSGALGNDYGLSETFVKMIPMALCALGIAVAFRMQIWNIGAEGQFYMGACAATWVPLNFPDLPAAVMLPAMFILGALAGGLWGLVAGWFKTKWLVNELISTLMMNYIAILWVDYLVYGDWRDPNGLNFPLTAAFPDAAMLPSFGDLRVHAGIFVVFIAAAVFTVLFRSSRWGYETMVIGSNPAAARYAGYCTQRAYCHVYQRRGMRACRHGGSFGHCRQAAARHQPGLRLHCHYYSVAGAFEPARHYSGIFSVCSYSRGRLYAANHGHFRSGGNNAAGRGAVFCGWHGNFYRLQTAYCERRC